MRVLSRLRVHHCFASACICVHFVSVNVHVHASVRVPKRVRVTGTLCFAGNMMLFDRDGIIKRYETPEHILAEFFELRLDYYSRRRLLLIQVTSNAEPTRPSN